MFNYFKFLLSNNVIASFIILFILVIKKLLKNKLSKRLNYKFYYLIILVLIISLFPINIFNSVICHFNNDYSYAENINGIDVIHNNIYNLNDFYIAIEKIPTEKLIYVLMIFWLLFMSFLFIAFMYSLFKINAIINNSNEADKIIEIFFDCKKMAKVEKEIKVMESNFTNIPFICGIFKTYIFVPKDITDNLSEKEIKYILLHEISHYKNKDIIVDYFIFIIRMIYCINPIVWLVFNNMKEEKEIICDINVIKIINEKNKIDYGNTIINFITKYKVNSIFNISTSFLNNKKNIKNRIKNIAEFSSNVENESFKSIFVFIFTFCLVFSYSVFAFSNNNTYNYNSYKLEYNNIEYCNLDNYFGDMKGSFVLYDSSKNKFFVYNKEESLKRISPNSTYKIYSALFALEENVITTDKSYIKWNGKSQPFELWNRDQNLESAIKNSVNWYFNYIDSKNGLYNLDKYFNYINYGNCNLSSGIYNYWLEGSSLKISTFEQVVLLNNFYNNTFGFNQDNIDEIKKCILISKNENSAIYGKTGTGKINNNTNGSFIGFMESKGNTYFFAANIKDNNYATGKTAMEIVFSILNF